MKNMYTFWLLITVFFCSFSFAQTQMDLPVSFDDPTVNYSTVDFGGTTSSFIVDPTNAANMVVQTEKTAGAQTWAGTTLALPGPGGPNVDTGFLNPVPFMAGATTMSVRVWSTGPGIPVRLKVEQQDNNTINCETEALTTVTNAWETLVFDFSNEAPGTAALNFANTYNMASLFYNFGSNGGGEIFYWDDVMFGAPPVSGLTQMDLPVTFDDPTVNYSTVDFGGTTSSFIVDPTNAANMVVQTEKTAGAQVWAGTTLALPGPGGPNVDTGFLNPVPFAAGATTMSVRVWATGPGIPVLLKVEDDRNNGITCEVTATTTVTNAWETLVFDFSAGAPALNFANTYNMTSLFYNFGSNGGGEIFYWDDVMFGAPPVSGLTQMDLPVTFDDPTVNYSTVDFGGTMSSFIVDPTNAANMVVQTEKTAGAQVWAGTTLALPGPGGPNVDTGFLNPIPFMAGATTMSVRVWATGPGIPVLLKVEDDRNNGITCEVTAMTTVTNAWETLVFDFSAGAPALNFANTYNMTSLFYNFGSNGGGEIFYWDDVMFGAPPVSGLTQMDLPVTFDDPTVNYSTVDFGGTMSSFIVDPTNAANMVVQTEKTAGAQVWAGTTLALPGPGGPNVDTGFLNPIPFMAGATTMSVRVWATGPGIPVLLKVEDDRNNGITCEVTATTTVTNAWETLVFDFSAGTPALNFANTYNMTSLFYNFGSNGGGEIFYWDDVMFGAPPVSGLTQMDLPVTFDDPTVNYSTVDFGGTMSSFIVDPTNAANMVVQTEKTAGAQVWAGTTLALPGPGGPNVDTGFLNPIPFMAGATTMSVRVWATGPGIPVLLKVEDDRNNGITCEVTATTTVTNAWETLVFDFSAGTPALNFANTYNMTSLFYNFGSNGGGEIFYWDDVIFGAPPVSGLTQMDLPVTFDDPTVNYSTVDFGGTMSSFIVDPTNAANMVVQTEKTAGAQVWAGTTLALPGPGGPNVDTGFLNPIPFMAGATTMSVRVWATGPGIPVLLKVEDDRNNGITCEVTATTTVTNAWETLVFDFSAGTPALNFANTYNMTSLFYNFGSNGGGEIFYWDDVMFGAPPVGGLTQMDLPVTFDDPTVNYSTLDFGNAASMFVADPTNAANMVVQTEKTVGAQTWAGTTLALPGIGFPPGTLNVDTGFLNNIPFSAGNTTMSVRVYSTGPGIPVRLKVEEDTDVTMTCETEAVTTVTNAWETLVFDFSNEATGTAQLNFASTYDKASLFYNFGSNGNGEIFYWDDVQFGGAPAPPLAQMDLPVNFDDTTVNYGVDDFGGNSSMIANDPTNANNKVVCSIKTAGAQTWAGTTLDAGTPKGFATPIPFSVTNTTMAVDVYSPAAGLTIMLKIEDKAAPSNTVFIESQALTTVANTWETLVFDFATPSNSAGGATLGTTTFDLASIFFDFNTMGAQDTFYWDNVVFGGTSMNPCMGVSPDASILDDFECQGNITYTFANATWTEDVVNPNPSGINTSAMVGEFIHWGAGTDGAFGGSLDLGPLDLSVIGTDFNMDVHPSAAGLEIIVVLQDSNGSDIDVQTNTTTVSGAWETLTYDMSAAAASNDVSNIVFVISPGDSTQHVVYIDNIQFDTATVVAPCAGVTPDENILDDFECQGNITYTFANATWTEDVTNPNPSGINTSSNVGEFIHWGAGTDGAFGGGLDLGPLALATLGSELKMDIHSSASGLPITVVMQDSNGSDLALQTSSTTVSGAWETLSFDMSAAASSNDVSSIVFVVSPGDSTQHVLYFDNIRLDTNSIVGTCPGVTPDQDILEDFDCQRNTTYTSIDGNLNVIPNPDATGINVSANVGEYARGAGATDEIRGDLNLAPLDFASHNQMQLDVWDANSPSEVTIVLEDASGIFLASATATTSASSTWEQLNFDFQTVPFTISVAKVVIQFDEGSQVDSNKIYYFDNLKMDGFVGIRDRSVSALNAYPNPTDDFFTLSFDDLDIQETLTVSVVSMDGKVVQTTEIASASGEITLDLSSLDDGVYIVETSSSKQTWINRVLKK